MDRYVRSVQPECLLAILCCLALIVTTLVTPAPDDTPLGLLNKGADKNGPVRTESPSLIPYDAYFVTEEPAGGKSVAVIVQDSLYSNVSSEVTQYCRDLEDSGYNTILYTGQVNSHQDLKDMLFQWYDSSSLVGAVLIGRLPYARFHHPASVQFDAETFICDLYLMDLDGTWSDTVPQDGIYDGHSGSALGDIYPEIFVGRIDPTCLSWGSGTATHIKEYLARLHAYRTGNLQRTNRALVYVDDDWSGIWGTLWSDDVGLAYPTRTLIQEPLLTTAEDWLNNRVPQDNQWTHICVHSSATMHYFGPYGDGEGTVSSSDIRAAGPASNFYNLFACSGAEWTAIDDLAVTYTFSGDYSLAAIGSTKTGGMMDCDYFYSALHSNATLGDGLVEWFSNALSPSSTAGPEYLQWYYGMAIIGDPVLTIIYDCTVLSPNIGSITHPDPNSWSSNPKPHFNWSLPADVNGISGFYYVVDQSPRTVPTPGGFAYTTVNGTYVSTNLSDGTWYIHVVARDSVGNVGKTAAHYRVRIDTESPTVTMVSPVALSNISTDHVGCSWNAWDSGSGYSFSQVWLDNTNSTVYTGPITNTTLIGLFHGMHIVNVTVLDCAGNSATEQISFMVDLLDPTVTITYPAEGSSVDSTLVLHWTMSDMGSGCHLVEVRIDSSLVGSFGGLSHLLQIENLSPGTHLLNVTVFDWANRSASDEVTVAVGYLVSDYFIAGALAVLAVVIIGTVLFRRRLK